MNIQIGELSRQTGVNIETIRFYEKQALFPEPPRSAGGRRQYDDTHVRRLSFIKRSRDIGFSLKEVRGLLSLVEGGYTCEEIQSITIKHKQDIQSKIRDLQKLNKTLEEMAARCTGKPIENCPVIDALFADR